MNNAEIAIPAMEGPSLRILFVVNNLDVGGTERAVCNIANGLVEAGHQVGIYSVGPAGRYGEGLDRRIALYCYETARKRPSKDMLLRDLIDYARNYEIIVAGTPLKTDFLVHRCMLAFRRQGIQKIYTVRIGTTLSLDPRFTRHIWRRYRLGRIYSGFDRVIANSYGVERDLKKLYGLANTRVVYNPVDLKKIKERAIEEPCIKVMEPFFTTAGRLSRAKDHPTLLRAFSLFAQQAGGGYHLVILGGGHRERQLRALCARLGLEGLVHFLGTVDNPWQYEARSIGFVSSSIIEGLPNAMIEAMACKTPIISTSCPSGPEELLQHGENGYLVEPRNPEALADAMSWLIAHPEEAKAKCDKAYAFVQGLDLPIIAQQYVQALTLEE